MIKWFAYIVLLLIFAPCLSSAKVKNKHFIAVSDKLRIGLPFSFTDTTKNNKKQEQDKIKEVAKAKKQPKPAKVEPVDNQANTKPKPKRQRRPEGMERPPEIPRRNGN